MVQLLHIIAEILEVETEELSLDTARDSFDTWDSMAHIQIIAEIEEQLGIKIPFEDISDIKTIRDLAKYIGE